MRLKLVLLLLLTPLAKGQQQMSHEEEVVRTTYAKLSYADEVRIIMKTMNALPDKFQADERSADKALASRLEFQLSDFKTGSVSEIEGRIMADVAGVPPEGDTQGALLVAPGTFNYKDNSAIGQGKTEWTVYATVSWNTQPQHRAAGDGWPVAALLNLKEMNGPYDRYATYTVTMTFQDKSRTYNTAALFGKNADGANVHFLDLISGNMTLDLLAKTDMSTAPFSRTDLRDVPFIRKWLNGNRQQGCSVKGHGDVCCNPETKKCGIGAAPASRWHREFREIQNPYLVLAGFHPKMSPVNAMFQTSCSSFNVETFYNHGNGDIAQHTSGQHTFTSVVDGTCVYSAPVGSTGPGTCNSSCSANANGTPADFGSLTGLLPHSHVPGMANKSGQEGNTPTTQCQGTNAISFMDCLTGTCTVSVSINGAANGVGAVITFANAALWNDSQAAVHNCPSKATTSTTTSGGGPIDPCLNGSTVSGGPTADFGTTGGGGGGNAPDCSPIIVDVTGDGFALTDAEHGVTFDITNDGIPIHMAWTANATNAFLALDRNGSSTITNGAELFGNFTSQPVSAHPNGFAALAVYDDPMNGGNGDGVIDARDKIFSSLRLWVDANHDGVSQSEELHTLPELGIYSISLDYQLSERKDQYGNLFRYRARVNQGLHGPNDVGKTAYDVFLVSK
jgi:hypothetical protein